MKFFLELLCTFYLLQWTLEVPFSYAMYNDYLVEKLWEDILELSSNQPLAYQLDHSPWKGKPKKKKRIWNINASRKFNYLNYKHYFCKSKLLTSLVKKLSGTKKLYIDQMFVIIVVVVLQRSLFRICKSLNVFNMLQNDIWGCPFYLLTKSCLFQIKVIHIFPWIYSLKYEKVDNDKRWQLWTIQATLDLKDHSTSEAARA